MNLKELEKIEMKNDGKDTERFSDLTRKLVTVPKTKIDAKLEAERQAKQERKDRKRKA